jgi:hypothetical protein
VPGHLYTPFVVGFTYLLLDGARPK